MLVAEDSAVVPKKDNYGRIVLPQRAEPDIAAGARERGVPFLAVDVDPGSPGAAASLAVRIEAFVEMLG